MSVMKHLFFDIQYKAQRAKISQFILPFFLLCSLVLNILLAWKLERVRGVYLKAMGDRSLIAGTLVPTIVGKDVQGRPASIIYNESPVPTVLYFFSPDCGWCTRNLPNLKALAENSHGKYRLIGISLSVEKLQDYILENNLDLPILCEIPSSLKATYKLGGTPETIVVSPDGQVLKTWSGAYNGLLRGRIEDYFGIHLPGIADLKLPEVKNVEQ